ncbi:lytic murein transglycosylase B [Burkholderia glumae]|uniref:lytic murein transglycosylase B n=1 Tax=Burkholderia glumae TaxID=337 RepID=UPI001295A353|nr:lytic murein transglycosylase B [Burkholderia glumae]MCM2550157.1 lytic murein transglycosylase B [Burkholderia glumae]QGA38480.1 lytic murein transglycosylase B [Burkholderia glumae]
MTFRSSAVFHPLRFRSRLPLASLSLAAVVATLAACAQTPTEPQAAAPATPTAPVAPAAVLDAPASASAPAPASAPAAAPAAATAPQLVPAAGLSASEEQIVPQQYANNPKIDAFIDEVAARDGFDPAKLHALFASANYSATAVRLVRPARSPSVKNWRAYQARFLDAIRINAGVKFWRANQATLQRASAEFGVPPEVIVGIIGVETIYGRYMGNFPTLDALTTLAFDYPDTPNRDDRQATFRKNLEDFLVWTRDSQLDPTSVLGSYTGAIGIPQFLPSSIRSYAVDYEGNGHIDLRASTADAIGSVANYLKQHGWEPGRPVVWQIAPDAGSQGVAQAAADGKPEPHLKLSQLTQAGLVLDEPSVDPAAEAGTLVTVVDLPSPGRATEYKLGLKNFYVLTRYNRSFFYALAVYQLGERVKQKMLATQ